MTKFREELRIILNSGYDNNDLFEAIDELHEKQGQILLIDSVSGWLHLQSNKELFDKEAKKNCKCLFECGSVIN